MSAKPPQARDAAPQYPRSLQLCTFYRNTGKCSTKACNGLHLCPKWLAGYCKAEANCSKAHSTLTDHNTRVLRHYMPRLPSKCEMRRYAAVRNQFVRPCTHHWSGKCRAGADKCRHLHCCPSIARGLKCPRAAACRLGHQLDQRPFEFRRIADRPGGNLPLVQLVWRYVVISDPYTKEKLSAAHDCCCPRCSGSAKGAAVGVAKAASSRAESVASSGACAESLSDQSLDEDDDDANAHEEGAGDFGDFDSEGEALDEKEDEEALEATNDLSYLRRMGSPTGSKASARERRNIEKPEPYKNALDFDNVFRHIKSAPMLTIDNVVSFLLLESEGSASVPEFIGHFALADNFPLEQWHQQQLDEQRDWLVLERDSLQGISRLNAYPRVRVCQFYNGAKDSCRNSKCQRLHVCLWWLADPDEKVHSQCGLSHKLANDHNKLLLQQLGLDRMGQPELARLLRACHPNVCRAYNADSSGAACPRGATCPDIHLCNNTLHPDNKSAKQLCPCPRKHVLELAADAAKLARFGLDGQNLNYLVKSYLVPAAAPNTLPAMAEAAVALPPAMPDLTLMSVSLKAVYAALIRRHGQATPAELLGDLQLPASFPLEQWRDAIDEQMKPQQCMIDIYKSVDGSQVLSVNVFRRFRLCPLHNGAPKSCQKADCCQLHLCLWYLADPEGRVHKKSDCHLCHDLSGRNHRIRNSLGIADGVKNADILQLLRSCHPNVCRDYNSDAGCSRLNCPDIHLCNNIMFRNRCKCSCRRQHVLTMDEQTKRKFFPFDLDQEENPGHVLRSYLVPAPLPNTNQSVFADGAAGVVPPFPPPVGSHAFPHPPHRMARPPPPQMARPPPPQMARPPPPRMVGPQPRFVHPLMQPNAQIPQQMQSQQQQLRMQQQAQEQLMQQQQQQNHKLQQQQSLDPSQEKKQNRREKKLAAASVPNLAGLKISGDSSTSGSGGRPSAPGKAKPHPQKPVKQASAASASTASAIASTTSGAAPISGQEVLCEEFLRHECYAQICSRLHCRHKTPFLWQWSSAASTMGVWQEVDPGLNRQLEDAFCVPDRSELVTVSQPGSNLASAFGPGQLTASFLTMEIRSSSGTNGSLRCLRTPSYAIQPRPLATQWRWYCLGIGGAATWSPVDVAEAGLSEQLEAAHSKGQESVKIGQFDCNFHHMLLTAPGLQMPLRRRPAAQYHGPGFPPSGMSHHPYMTGGPPQPMMNPYSAQGPSGFYPQLPMGAPIQPRFPPPGSSRGGF